MLYKLGQNNDKIDDIGNLFGILIDQKPVKD